MPFAGSKRSTMAVLPTRRQGGHVKKRKSGSDEYVWSGCKLCTGATIGAKKARRIDAEQKFSQKSSGSRWAGSLCDFSGSEASRAKSKGNSTRIASQESRFSAAPQQHSNTSESLAHAIIRGFMMRTVKKLPEFLERRAMSILPKELWYLRRNQTPKYQTPNAHNPPRLCSKTEPSLLILNFPPIHLWKVPSQK